MPATDTKLRPQMQPGKEDGEFVVFENVCIFDEHISDDGVTYDKRLLECIAENCNSRIRDTGDWCPVVDLHTVEGGKREDEPPVVGLAGPFHVGTFGNESPRNAIFCTFWIFKDQVELFRRRPRRSVEIWPEERPEDRYFDPIAILGAETPRRDLGLIYSKARSKDTKPIRYEASSPGGANTYIPEPVKQKPIHNSKEADQMLSPDELGQIVEALKPTLQQMVDEIGLAADRVGEEPVIEQDEALVDAVDPMAEVEVDDPALEGPRPEEGAEDYGQGKYMADGLREYIGEDGGDVEGASSYLDALDEEDRDGIEKYMKYGCDEDDMKELYEKATVINFPGEGVSRDVEQGHQGEAEAEVYEAEKYQKARTRYAKLSREHASLKAKYSKLEGEVQEIRKAERYAKRKGELTEKQSTGIVFDIEDEFEEIKDISEEQYAVHLDRMERNYQRIPGGEMIPVDSETPAAHGAASVAASAKYARQARDLVQRFRRAGKKANYSQVLNSLVASKGDEGTVEKELSI